MKFCGDMREIAWQDILRDWEVDEVERYRQIYEARGFDSWREWRQCYINELRLDERTWTQEILDRPYEVVPSFVIGGYPGWHLYRPAEKVLATFADVAQSVVPGALSYAGEPRVDVRTNEGVMRFTRQLDDPKLLILQSGDLRVVLDGTHRSAAIAVAAHDALTPLIETITVRIAHFDTYERSLLESFAKDRRLVVKKSSD